MEYFILKATGENEDAYIDALPEGSPADWKFAEGIELAADFPSKGTVQFSDNYSDGRRLLDIVANIFQTWIVSSRAREVLEAASIDNVEYLPITILNHRGKVAGKNYFVANVLGSQPAIDMKKSEVMMSKLSGEVQKIRRLVVDKAKIDKKAKLFRASTFKKLFFIRDDALKALVDAGITGFKTYPADGWDGYDT